MIGLGITTELFLGFAVILFLRYINRPDPPAVFGIYQRPKKFFIFKFVFMYITTTCKQWFQRYLRRRAVRKEKSSDGNIEVHAFDAEWDKEQPLGILPKAVDAVYFNGASKEGAALICGCARRQGNACDSFIYLKTETGELLESLSLPDTYLMQSEEEVGKYSVAGLKISPAIPMRLWNIKYDGVLKSSKDKEKRVNVKLDLIWNTKWDPFNFNFLSPQVMASALAKEQWSKDYFENMKRLHQNHYEQFGNITGTAIIDGVESKLEMECVRDHTFGPHRDWRQYHRYVLHFISLDNGEFLAVGKLCVPSMLSDLSFGYICGTGKPYPSSFDVHPVTWCNLKLYEHGENKTPPTDYAFEVKAGGRLFVVSVSVTDSPTFYLGKDRDALVFERLATFEVNGVKGWGSTEWQYRNVVK